MEPDPSISLAQIEALLAPYALQLMGGFQCQTDDGVGRNVRTLLLIGPRGPDFWSHFLGQPEWQDGQPDPIDRWSRRVIGERACELGGKAYFPFGGPPHRPFYQWALRSARAWASPVTLLVHDTAGLMISYRGAIGLTARVALPMASETPCLSCADKPCLSACPAGALTARGYDVSACHRFLDTEPGQDCLSRGCRVRRACPVSQAYGRVEEQSAYHMRLFHR